jgi:hypothetical protein
MNVIKVKRTIRKRATKRSSLRELTDTVAWERTWQFAVEALLFAIIAIVSAWPLIVAADALNKFLQRT